MLYIGGYILVNSKTRNVAHYTFARNRHHCWKAAERYATRKYLKATGWKCVYVSADVNM